MRAQCSIFVVMTLAGLAAASAGCAGDTAAAPGDGQGTVTFDLMIAPTDARCAVITVTPAMGTAIVRQFPLAPSQPTVFSLSGLPTGDVTISENVFTVACAMTGTATATWTADPVMVTLQAGVPVSVTFNLRRVDGGGQVNVGTNFPQPPGRFQEFPQTPAMNGSTFDLITAGPDDNLWFTDAQGNRIGRTTPGGATTFFPVPTPNAFPTAIAAGSDGNLWVTENTVGKIARFTTTGTVTEFSLPSATSDPFLIAAGPDGNLWFTEVGNNSIGRMTPSGVATEFAIPTAGSAPAAIATGPDRNIWFAESTGNKIARVTPTGTFTEFAIPTAASRPFGIVAGNDGNIWFTEESANRIGRATTGGSIVEFAIPTAGEPVIATPGPDGNIWFTEAVGDQIARITPTGTVSEFAIPTASALPIGITAGPDGRLWFLEEATSIVGAFRP
jgi:streptogramin lyase